ncbi:MAG TPA: alpha/beta hydrolase [Pseudonocardiaceae bacterium]
METRDYVVGAGGVRLAVRESGPPGAPAVILLHGWAQSAEAWTVRPIPGVLPDPAGRFRVLTVDLRGHGDSDVPAEDVGGYGDSATWAADVAALLDHVGTPAVLVGWSYGGLVITDYLRHHGTTGVAGVVLVGAITEIGRGRRGGRVGPVMRAALPAALSEDRAVAEPALREFARGMTDRPLPEELGRHLLEVSLATPAPVRRALFAREADSAEVLTAVDVPVLVVHGEDDAVVDPSCARFVAEHVPHAEVSWYPTGGHVPFLVEPERFGKELAEFVRRCWTERTGSQR